jgi:hypothetical protein
MTLFFPGNKIKQLTMLIKCIENNHLKREHQKIFLSALITNE